MEKRKAPSSPPSGTLIKRARASSPERNNQIAISSAGDNNKGLVRTVQRTSGLEAPIVSLAGAHSAEVHCARFDPTGQNIAAGSGDKTISLWRTYPPTTNYGHFTTIHKAAVLDLHWSLHSPLLYSVSADRTLAITDVTSGQRVRKIVAHHGVINALDRTIAGGAGIELLATAADDNTVKIWEGGDDAAKEPVAEFDIGCPATAVAWSADGSQVYVGAVDNAVHVWDLRKQAEVFTLGGHGDTVCSLSLSPNGHFLLSPALDGSTIVHDVRPFSPAPDRIHRSLAGHVPGYESSLYKSAWSRDDGGQRVAVGGSDRTVTIWEVESGKILYKLPGHKGAVGAVDFHPKEPIILTGSKDAIMLLGEIEQSLF
ncbi:WD40 repeat-like protein [Auriculariales sp. MPI-PUGE-AT-0066]|nr:WD40 repeat-like protein [Auriculariales sp. MPI-PUGE-AT-0066]